MSSTKPVAQQAALKSGERLELTLESWGRLGEAMAWHDGSPVFVFGGIPGERVTAEVLRVHRKYASATVVDVLEPAPERVAPPCQYFGECTGCQWQHLDYDAQLAVKRDKVIDALVRVGGLFSDPSDAPVADTRCLRPTATATATTPASPSARVAPWDSSTAKPAASCK